MRYPNFIEEKKLWKKGFKFVAGLDEAGRGPLAGPVVAAAVIVNPKHEIRNLKLIFNDKNLKCVRDSKQLSPKKRGELYNIVTTHSHIRWGIGIVSEKVIDKINILEATKIAMKNAVAQLDVEPDFLLLDGNFKLDLKRAAFAKGFGEPKQKPIIKADKKVFSCAAASIIAKVTRDRIMQKYHKKYPEYGFDRHKGYPTKSHFECLQKLGPCKIHRKSFYPIQPRHSTGQDLSTG